MNRLVCPNPNCFRRHSTKVRSNFKNRMSLHKHLAQKDECRACYRSSLHPPPTKKRKKDDREDEEDEGITSPELNDDPKSYLVELMAEIQSVVSEHSCSSSDDFPMEDDYQYDDPSWVSSTSNTQSEPRTASDDSSTNSSRKNCSTSCGESSHPYILTQHQIDTWFPGIQLPPDIEFLIALYSLLCHPRIPRYIFTYAVKLVNAFFHPSDKDQLAYLREHNTQPFPESRQHVENYVRKHFPATKGKTYSIPQETSLDSSKKSSVETVVFDPIDIIRTSISSPLLACPEKVALNSQSYWEKNQPPLSYLPNGSPNRSASGTQRQSITEMVESKAYRDAYDKFIQKPEEELLVVYRAWMDETGTTQNLRFPAQPLHVTCGLLKRTYQFPQILAYLPCFVKSKAEKTSDRGTEDNLGISTRNMHLCLSQIFKMWDKAFDHYSRKKYAVRLGKEVKSVYIRPIILFFGGDAKSQDLLCCRYGYSTYRVCRTCESVPSWEADNPDGGLGPPMDEVRIKEQVHLITDSTKQLSLLEKKIEDLTLSKSNVPKGRGSSTVKAQLQSEIKKCEQSKKEFSERIKGAREILKKFSTHYCENAFWAFKAFGGSILLYSPHDHMHIFLIGISGDVLESTVGLFPPSMKTDLEQIIKVVFLKNTSSERSKFPRFPLRRGVTNLTLNTAQEWNGLVFVLLLVTQLPSGAKLLKEAFSKLRKKIHGLVKERLIKLKAELKKCEMKEKNAASNAAIPSCGQDPASDPMEQINDTEEEEETDVHHDSIPSGVPTHSDRDGYTSDVEDDVSSSPNINATRDMLKGKIEYLQGIIRAGLSNIKVTASSFAVLLEHMLIYHAAAYAPEHSWCADDAKMWSSNTSKLMHMIKKNSPRCEGNCWCKPKYHGMKHLPSDIPKFGSPLNFDCMSDEHSLQYFVKWLALTVRKNNLESFTESLGKRLYETQCLERLKQTLAPMNPPFLKVANQMIDDKFTNTPDEFETDTFDVNEEDSASDSEADVHLDSNERPKNIQPPKDPDWFVKFKVVPLVGLRGDGEGEGPLKVSHNRTRDRPLLTLHLLETHILKNKAFDDLIIPALKRDLVAVLHDDTNGDTTWKVGHIISINGYFWCKRKVKGSNISSPFSVLRADPKFTDGFPRYDYVQQSFCHEGNDTRITEEMINLGVTPYGIVPAKILCFYEHPTRNTVRAVLHPCAWKVSTCNDTRLTELWRKEIEPVGHLHKQVFLDDGTIMNAQKYRRFFPGIPNFLRILTAKTVGVDVDELGKTIFVVEESPLLQDIYTTTDMSNDVDACVYAKDSKRYWKQWFLRDDYGEKTHAGNYI